LRRDINLTLDPTFDASGSETNSLLRFLEGGQRPDGMNARGLRVDEGADNAGLHPSPHKASNSTNPRLRLFTWRKAKND